MTTGLDTGFFVRLLQEDSTAEHVWARITSGRAAGVLSCLSLYELEKQGLNGLVQREATETLVRELPHVCMVVWLDNPDLLRRAARIAHGNALAMADALILTSLIEAGAEEVYTTDRDLEAYAAGPRVVLL